MAPYGVARLCRQPKFYRISRYFTEQKEDPRLQGIVNEMDKSEKSKIKDKTNAMRIIESKKLEYKLFTCPCEEAKSADEIAVIFGKEPERVFKTLVTVGKSGEHYVFMLPACDELDLKKAAKAVGEKSVEMIKSKELLPLTGYIHGGCSPVGMKKFFPHHRAHHREGLRDRHLQRGKDRLDDGDGTRRPRARDTARICRHYPRA